MDDDDLGIGEVDAAIDCTNGRVVPLADLAEVDAGENLGGETEVLAGARQMVDGDDGPDDGRELEYFDGHLGHVGIGEGNVGGRQGDFLVVELLNTGLGADAVVGDVDVGMAVAEGLDPGLIEGGREGGSRGLDHDTLGGWGWGSGWGGFVHRR